MSLRIVRADYHNPQHQQDLIYLLDQYARDPMGGGEGLKASVKETLIDQLQKDESKLLFLLDLQSILRRCLLLDLTNLDTFLEDELQQYVQRSLNQVSN